MKNLLSPQINNFYTAYENLSPYDSEHVTGFKSNKRKAFTVTWIISRIAIDYWYVLEVLHREFVAYDA